MNDDREVILSRVRGALAPLPKRAAYPDFPDDVAVMREVVDLQGSVDAYSASGPDS